MTHPWLPAQRMAGNLHLEVDSRRAFVAGREVPLSRQCWELLIDLVDHAGRVRTRDQLITAAWPPNFGGIPKTVDVHVRWLRAALVDVDGATITTVTGAGYRFDVEPGATMRRQTPPPTPRTAARRTAAGGPRPNPGLNPSHPWRVGPAA